MARKSKRHPTAPLGTGERFRSLVREIQKRGGAYDARAIAAAIGRRKYGKARFQAMAAAGKRRASKRGPRRAARR